MESFFFTPDEMRKQFAPSLTRAELEAGVYLMGCGGVGAMMRDYLHDSSVPIIGLVDNNPEVHGKRMWDLPVLSLKEFARRREDKALLLSMAKNIQSARSQCRELGITRLIPYYEVMRILRICPFKTEMTAAQVENDSEAREGYRLWAENESREKYRASVRFYVTLDDAKAPGHEDGQYFSPRYMPRRFLRSVVDAGAFTGDTLRSFLETTGGNFKHYYAFEPDPANYRKLLDVRKTGRGDIQTFKLGVGSAPGLAMMRSCGTSVSSLLDEGETEIQVETLDRVLEGKPVTLIKMDIEGFETEALRGAEKIIREQRPALAISIYHQIDHFWSIPLWIKRLNCGYSFQLGFHGYINGEAVCYAIPPE